MTGDSDDVPNFFDDDSPIPHSLTCLLVCLYKFTTSIRRILPEHLIVGVTCTAL